MNLWIILFLKVRPGDAVLEQADQIGKALTFIGGSRDPGAPTLFQIANLDSGKIRWVHGEEVSEQFVNIGQQLKSLILFMNKFSSYNNAAMKHFKNLFPIIAAIGVFFLASNSIIWKQMNQKPPVKLIKPIPVKEFK
tara:strand:- start:91 stop:501 length:411 start_codon:yes stop_codon:yes gene_type:complete